MEMRSDLARVRGLGSAKEGTATWWAQRLTAIALVPLTLWFVVSAIALVGADLGDFREWLGVHGNALLMVLFVLALFHHAQLGVVEVIEDYVHGHGAKIASLIAVKFAAALFAASSVLAVLAVGYGG